MKEAITLVITNFTSFIGNNVIGYVMWACFCAGVVYLLVKGNYFEKVVSILSIIGFLIFFNPITYKIIGERFVSGVYWRMFWVIPVVLVMATAFTELAYNMGKKSGIRFVLVLVICAIVAKIGVCTFDPTTFVVAENAYELPEYTVEVAELILRDAKNNDTIATRIRRTGAQSETITTNNEYPLVLVPDEMVTTMRQYTSKIAIAYGRNIWGHICAVSEPQKELQALLSDTAVDFEELHAKAFVFGCDYIVVAQNRYTNLETMKATDFAKVGETCGYEVYRVLESGSNH